MEEYRGTLRDEIQRLNENFEEAVSKKEVKKFRLPFMSRVGKKKIRDGWATIIHIDNNKALKFLKAPIKEGTILIDGIPHIATAKYMLTYKNRPVIIVSSWSIEPYAPEENLKKAEQEGKLTVGYKLLLNIMKSEQLKTKPKIGFGIILLILAAIGAGIYYISKGGF